MGLLDAGKKLRNEASYIRRRVFFSRFVPTSSDAFATHMPVLLAVAALESPCRILELGSGEFSTPGFADSTLFPTAEQVHTMEDDIEWGNVVRALPLDPARSHLEVVPSIRARLSEIDLSPYDMIFVDNAMSVVERAATLRVVLEKSPPDVIIVIHDFEWRAYRAEVRGPWRAYTFKAWRPFTGVIWQGNRLNVEQLAPLQRIMRENRAHSPAKAEYWRDRIFEHLTL